MKKILIFLIVTFLFADNKELVKEYEEMFKKISEKRIGLDEKEIERVKSPFVLVAKNTNELNISKKINNYILEAILNNKVLINGKWYKLYSKIGDAKIISIKHDSVLIKGDNYTQKLMIRKKNEYISIK